MGYSFVVLVLSCVMFFWCNQTQLIIFSNRDEHNKKEIFFKKCQNKEIKDLRANLVYLLFYFNFPMRKIFGLIYTIL